MSPALLIAVLPFVVVISMFWGIGRPARITLEIDGGMLRVRLGFWDALYSVRRTVQVALDAVADVRVSPRSEVPATGLRLPGARVPGLIRAGSYGVGRKRDFWDVRRGRELLVIQLRPGQPYRRIILEVADPQSELRRLQAALAG